MTVEELIEELKQMPPTASVVFEVNDEYSYDFARVSYSRGVAVIIPDIARGKDA